MIDASRLLDLYFLTIFLIVIRIYAILQITFNVSLQLVTLCIFIDYLNLRQCLSAVAISFNKNACRHTTNRCSSFFQYLQQKTRAMLLNPFKDTTNTSKLKPLKIRWQNAKQPTFYMPLIFVRKIRTFITFPITNVHSSASITSSKQSV